MPTVLVLAPSAIVSLWEPALRAAGLELVSATEPRRVKPELLDSAPAVILADAAGWVGRLRRDPRASAIPIVSASFLGDVIPAALTYPLRPATTLNAGDRYRPEVVAAAVVEAIRRGPPGQWSRRERLGLRVQVAGLAVLGVTGCAFFVLQLRGRTVGASLLGRLWYVGIAAAMVFLDIGGALASGRRKRLSTLTWFFVTIATVTVLATALDLVLR